MGIAAPLVLLSALALFSGFIGVPSFLGAVAPPPDTAAQVDTTLAGVLSALVPVLGAAAAYVVFFKRRAWVEGLPEKGFVAGLHAFLRSGWGFDRLYERLFVRPYLLAARAGREDFMDAPYAGAAKAAELLSRLLAKTQSGQVRRYAAGMTIGALLALGALAFI